MKNEKKLIEFITIREPKNITIKRSKKSMVLIAPDYSDQSSIFDSALRYAYSVGIKTDVKQNPLTIKFTEK